MKVSILILGLVATVRGIDLFEDIIAFKEDLLNGVFGKGKCGCPCRDYYVPKCEVTYVQQCYYEHYEEVCHQVPVPQVVQAKEIECQKCRKYKVPVPKTKWVKECNPVYDEKCETEYHQHCKEETRCHIIYQTICDNSGYQQHCGSQPRQHCYPETKCHRMPDTRCVPIQKEKCAKVPVETTEYVEEKQCLPFELDLAQMSAQHGDPCAGYQVPQDHHHHSSGGGHVDHQPALVGGYQTPTFNSAPVTTGYSSQPIITTTTNVDHFHHGGLTANQYGIQDSILQHQPISNQYEVKRETPKQTLPSTVGNDNPFLRRPKSIRVTMKRLDNLEQKKDDGSEGWIPIPYPLYKK